MRTDLIDLDNIPNNTELSFLLGPDIYNYYMQICKEIILSLSPDIERWAKGGRHGKYLHGYIIEKKAIFIDLFFISDTDFKQLKCNFHFPKKIFEKILKQKQLFSKVGQEAIESSIRLYKEYPHGFTLELRISNDKKIFDDVIHVINIINNASNRALLK